MENLPLQEETDSLAGLTIQDSAESDAPSIPAAEAETETVDVIQDDAEEELVRKVINEALGDNVSGFKLIVLTVHIVFLESGFVRVNQDSSIAVRCLQVTDDSPSVCSWRYTLPEIVGDGTSHCVNMEFRTLGNLVEVCGSLSESTKPTHCVSFDKHKSAKLLELMLANSEYKASVKDFSFGDEVFKMWKFAKDLLAIPLMIDLCEKAGLDLPPCWTRLSTDQKLMILERLPGVDLARVACTCSELRYLSSTKDLWKKSTLRVEETRILRKLYKPSPKMRATVRKTLYPYKAFMLVSSKLVGNQSPLRRSRSGHITANERRAPNSKDKFTRWGQIIPAPT
ncbi:putative F-box protein, partial [Mucuna pruriens]